MKGARNVGKEQLEQMLRVSAEGGGEGRAEAPGPWGGSWILPRASSRGGGTVKEACTERPSGWYKDYVYSYSQPTLRVKY